MEPLWLGAAAPSLISNLSQAARKITQPFSAALDAAESLFQEEELAEIEGSSVAAHENPHTRLLSEVLTGHPLVGDETALRIEDISHHAENLQDELGRRLEAALSQAGIKPSGEIKLGISRHDGSLEVLSDSPERAAIEKALSADPTLAADFRRLSSLRSLVAAAEKSTEFADAYERDPYQAITQFGSLLDRSDEASLLRTEFATEIRFEPTHTNSL